ncbi:MAG: response regulator [Thiomicrospira sp.]
MARKLLVIDDDPVFLKMLRWRLSTELDCQVTVAKRPLEALRILERDSFDLVISDVKLPEMSGYELARSIHNKIPEQDLILMSGYYLDPVKYESCGALGFLEKPFEVGSLKSSF